MTTISIDFQNSSAWKAVMAAYSRGIDQAIAESIETGEDVTITVARRTTQALDSTLEYADIDEADSLAHPII